MKSCTGIDYKEFYNFLKVIGENRISVLEKGLDEESSSQNNSRAAISTLGMLHAVFDLKRAVKVLSSLSANEDFRRLDLASLSPSPEVLLHHLESAIDTALLWIPALPALSQLFSKGFGGNGFLLGGVKHKRFTPAGGRENIPKAFGGIREKSNPIWKKIPNFLRIVSRHSGKKFPTDEIRKWNEANSLCLSSALLC